MIEWALDERVDSTTSPTITNFGEDINNTQTKKQRMESIYNRIAKKEWYEDIMEFYIEKKMMLMMWDEDLTASDEKLIKLLASIANDLWYGGSSKEFIMSHWLSGIQWNDMIWK